MKFGWLIILILFIIIFLLYITKQNKDVIYVKSEADEKLYLVRDASDKEKAANLLATIKKNIITITDHLYNNIHNHRPYQQYILQLHERIKNVVIMESSEDSVYTSYSANKGEQIVFCLRSRNIPNKLHKLNLLMYVVLHEMSHVACPEFGHTDLFKKIFAFITTIAIKMKLYDRIDFYDNNTEYCGLMITDSII